jgi:ankyrin repeat protein
MSSKSLHFFYRVKSTPLLLASSSGGLSAVKCLISLGADIRRIDAQGNNMVTLAALRFHTNVLEYFIEWNNPFIPVWRLLVGTWLISDSEDDENNFD